MVTSCGASIMFLVESVQSLISVIVTVYLKFKSPKLSLACISNSNMIGYVEIPRLLGYKVLNSHYYS